MARNEKKKDETFLENRQRSDSIGSLEQCSVESGTESSQVAPFSLAVEVTVCEPAHPTIPQPRGRFPRRSIFTLTMFEESDSIAQSPAPSIASATLQYRARAVPCGYSQYA
jgi:hypothetical protein